MVTVHHFKVWDRERDTHVVHPMKGTIKRIMEIGGEIVDGTAEMVAQVALDAEGLFNPLQLGI